MAFELDLCAEMMNRTLEGIEGIDTSMHLCHAHFAREVCGLKITTYNVM